MRLIIPIVSVVLAIALAGAVWLLEERNLEEAQEISKLKAEVADKSVSQGFDFKRQCAAQADRFFKFWNNDPKSSSRYESHYNSSRRACFILILASDDSSNNQSENYLELTLFDAVERRQYAYLFKWDEPGQLPICTLMPGDGEQKACDSREEFNEFAANYMESIPDLQ